MYLFTLQATLGVFIWTSISTGTGQQLLIIKFFYLQQKRIVMLGLVLFKNFYLLGVSANVNCNPSCI